MDKEEIEQLQEGLKEIKDGQRKTAEQQEKKIQEIASTKLDGASWPDIVSKEEVREQECRRDHTEKTKKERI